MKYIVIFLYLITILLPACDQKTETVAPQPPTVQFAIAPFELPPDINSKMVATGEKIFVEKCSACHKWEERYIGPMLSGITQRRKPEWIMNMILQPEKMLQNDETARQLLSEYYVPMTFQNITQEEARAILEYFRSLEKK